MQYFKLLIDKKLKFLAFIQVITPKLDIFPSLLLREKVARNATDEESKTKSEHYVLIDSNINRHSFAFSFDTRGAKEKASQKEKRRFFGGSAPLDPVRFLKKAKPKTFQLG